MYHHLNNSKLLFKNVFICRGRGTLALGGIIKVPTPPPPPPPSITHTQGNTNMSMVMVSLGIPRLAKGHLSVVQNEGHD